MSRWWCDWLDLHFGLIAARPEHGCVLFVTALARLPRATNARPIVRYIALWWLVDAGRPRGDVRTFCNDRRFLVSDRCYSLIRGCMPVSRWAQSNCSFNLINSTRLYTHTKCSPLKVVSTGSLLAVSQSVHLLHVICTTLSSHIHELSHKLRPYSHTTPPSKS